MNIVRETCNEQLFQGDHTDLFIYVMLFILLSLELFCIAYEQQLVETVCQAARMLWIFTKQTAANQ